MDKMRHVIIPLLLAFVLSTFVYFCLFESLLSTNTYNQTFSRQPRDIYSKFKVKLVSQILPGPRVENDGSDDVHPVDLTQKSEGAKPPHLGKCEEMFSISDSFDDKSILDLRMLNSIRKIKDNMEKDFGGDTLPYSELSTFLPPQIIKNFPRWKYSTELITEKSLITKDIKRRAQKLVEDLPNKISNITSEAIIIARSYMLAHQRNFSYKLRLGHRLQWMQGRVPFVPCRIRDSFDSESLRHCVQKTAASRSDPFHLALFGDSKIRGLFVTFLTETYKLKYALRQKGKAMSFKSYLFNLQKNSKAPYTEAYSTSPGGLHVSLTFETFQYTEASALNASYGVQKLLNWSTGAEKAPDLLVIGYAQWILFMMHTHNHLMVVATDTLDFIRSIDEVVIKLLKNLSSKTLVLVLAQSRNRPHALTTQDVIVQNTCSTENLEWTESMFLSILKKYRYLNEIETVSYATDGLRSSTRTTPTGNMQSPASNLIHKVNHDKMLETNSGVLNSYTVSSASTETQLVDEVQFHKNLQQPYNDLQKHVTGGFWFWDTSLPFNLAEIRDCNTMFSHDPISVKLIPIAAKILGFKLNFIYPLFKIGAKIDKLLPPENITDSTSVEFPRYSSLKTHVFFRKVHEMARQAHIKAISYRDTTSQASIRTVSNKDRTPEPSLGTVSNKDMASQDAIDTTSNRDAPLQVTITTIPNQATAPHSQLSYYSKSKKQNQPVKNVLLKESRLQESLQAQLDYYDEFASAYSWRDLHCTDSTHAGTATEQVEVLQILNLICNRHLNLPREYCCTSP